ncbi:MAG TPA: SemiSWEET transporter [Caulobacteraceae bacterium]|nr:SemiSWEET transporter [Caulobacteraceae bacterium]
MNILIIDAVGVAAAICSMSSFAPQLVKIWHDRDASSVSLRMYLVTVAGFALWIAYGILIAQWPIVASNTVCLAMSGAVIALKWRFDRRRRRRP